METIRDLRIRIKSINSTKKITQSMRMIATSKVQKVTRRMDENRAYMEQSVKIMKSMTRNIDFSVHDYVAGHETKDNMETGKPLIIVITGDRGLCGGYNVNASKEAVALCDKLGDADFITIGSKGRDYLRRKKKNIIHIYKGLSESPFYKDAQNIGNSALKLFNEKKASKIYLVSTEYHSMLVQKPKFAQLLPFDFKIDAAEKEEMNCDTNAGELFKYAAAIYIHSSIFGAMLESAVCEQCAKLTGMDSAVKNSEKIIDALTLQYNQMRQSAITQEIAEIVGGANAVEKD